MHLVAVNLWVWFRYVLVKEAVKSMKTADADNFDHRNYSTSFVRFCTLS